MVLWTIFSIQEVVTRTMTEGEKFIQNTASSRGHFAVDVGYSTKKRSFNVHDAADRYVRFKIYILDAC